MAQTVMVTLVDDLDGSEAVTTVSFGYQGDDYEIDLSEVNADRVRDALAPYIAAGRKAQTQRRGITRRARRAADRRHTAEVRAWAASTGMQIKDRGRIPAHVLAEYEAAHSGPEQPREAPAGQASSERQPKGSDTAARGRRAAPRRSRQSKLTPA